MFSLLNTVAQVGLQCKRTCVKLLPMTYSVVNFELKRTTVRSRVQQVKDSLRRAEKNGERENYSQRMLIKLRIDAAIKDIGRWYENGESLEQIAVRLDTTANTIWRRLKKMGVETRRAVRYNRKPFCDICGRPSKGYSKFCNLHWRLKEAERSYRWFQNNKKKGASCPVNYV